MRRFAAPLLLLIFISIFPTFSVVSSNSLQEDDTMMRTKLKTQAVMMASMSALPEKQPKWSYQSVGTVNVVSISSNELYVVMGTSDGYVYLFNSSSNAPLSAANIGGSVSAISISQYGNYLAAATGNTLMTYNVTTGLLQPIWSFSNVPGYNNEGGIQSLAFSFDGRFLVAGTWKGDYGERSYVHLFDITNSTPRWSAVITSARYNPPDLVTVDTSSDGQYIVAGSTRNNRVYLFSQTSSTPLYSYDTGASINAVSMSSNGNNFAAGGSSVFYFQSNLTIPVWIRNLGGSITSGALETDGAYIAAATGNFLYLLRNDNVVVWSYEFGASIGSISASEETEYQFVRSGNYAYLFSRDLDGEPATPQHEPLWYSNIETSVNSVSISSDGRYCVVGGGSYLYFFDGSLDPNLVPTVIQFSSNSPADGDAIVISAIVNNTGNLDSPIASVLFFFDDILVGANQIQSITKGSSLNTSLSCIVSPSGNHMIKVVVDPGDIIFESNETDNMLTKSLSVNSKPFVDTGANPVVTEITQTGTTRSVSISGNGYYAIAGTSDGYLYMFFKNHTIPLWSYKVSGAIDVVSLSNDGSYCAFASGNTLYVFGRTSSTPLWSFSNVPGYNNEGGVYSLVFSSDGRFLAAGTWKGDYGERSYVHLFDITNGIPLWSATITNARYDPPDYVTVDVSSDGQYIVAGSTRNNRVYLFSSVTPTPLYSYDTGASINAVSMSSNGDNFAAGGNKVYYFDKDIIVPLWTKDLGGTVSLVSISGNSTYMVAIKGNYLYSLKNDNTESWNYNMSTSISRALISEDGSHIIAASGNRAYLFSRVTDGNLTTPAHDPIWSYDTENAVSSISISSDGRYAIFGSSGKTFFFDAQHKADLLPTSISFSNNKPNEGDIIAISATINNTGAYKSYYANVSFYDGSTLIGKVLVNPIFPNSSTTASKTYQCVAGTRTIKIIVDPDDIIHESDKTNNQLTTTIFVNSRPTAVTLYNPSDITASSMKLSWTRNTESDFLYYQILISSQPYLQYFDGIETIYDQSVTSYNVTSLEPSKTYYFIIRTYSQQQIYSDSNMVSASTKSNPVIPPFPPSVSLNLLTEIIVIGTSALFGVLLIRYFRRRSSKP